MQTLQSQIRWCARFQWFLGGTMLVVVTAFLIFGYRPEMRRLRELALKTADCQRELTEARLQTRILPEVAIEVERLRLRLERSRKSVPNHQELPQFIRDVTQLSQQANLRKFSYKLGLPTRADSVSEIPITLNFEGDFVNAFSFLRNTEEMPRLTRMRGMNVKTRDRDKSGQVQVQLSMNIYFSAE